MILLVDDDPGILLALEAMCMELELDFTSFSSPILALDYLADNNHKAVPLIICDYKMPELNGIEFIETVNHLYKNIQAILITAHDNPEVAIRALEVGAYDYITKPINFKELSILTKRAIRQKEIKDENSKLFEKLKNIENPKFSFIGKSKSVENIKAMINKVAKTNANVLITGETGTGKEVVAKSIHQSSDRKNKEMISINCASIPANLLESELFGHTKGAFTGALKDKVGLFEEANKGIIFLDEIGDMPLELQPKLLRVLQEGKIRKIGDNKEIEIDVRVIAATNNSLIQKIKNNEFREDLYYRLNVINIAIPSLKDRKEDIALLVDYFLKKNQKNNKTFAKGITKEAIAKLMSHDWPGNIRELENTIERATILSQKTDLDEDCIILNQNTNNQSFGPESFKKLQSLDEVEKEYINYVLAQTNYIKDKAASVLGINRKTLYKKLKDYDLE